MLQLRTRLLRVTAVVAMGALVLGSATAANAAGKPRSSGAPVISINVTNEGGFTLPKTVHAGFVTFKVSTPEPTFHAVQGLRLENGATLQQVLDDLTLGLSDIPAENAEGHRRLLEHATLIGGVVPGNFAPISVTVPMEPGTYYFMDLNDWFIGVTPRVHTLRAVGKFHGSGLPSYDAVIVATMAGEDPVFNMPSDLSAQGTFLVVVAGDELHEAVFRQVLPGTTDEYIQRYYEAFLAGNPIARPWVDIQHGLQAMSPGRYAVMHIDLPPAPYAMLCLVPSDESGLPHAYIGMHQIVNLH